MKKKILAALTAGILTTGLMTGGVFAADTEVKGDENLKGEVYAFIAASLSNSMEEIQKDFNELYPNVTIYYSADSSGTLQTQIEEGARCDLFFSAADKQMDALTEEKLTKEDTVVDRMMENTDPEYVSLLFDTGHFTYCGEDPLEVVKKYVHRIKHVHLKDIRPEVVEQVKKENMSFLAGVRAGAFTIPGDGCINYDPIFKVLEEAGYEGYMVVEAEQDPAKANPLEYAIRARKFIAEKTGL